MELIGAGGGCRSLQALFFCTIGSCVAYENNLILDLAMTHDSQRSRGLRREEANKDLRCLILM